MKLIILKKTLRINNSPKLICKIILFLFVLAGIIGPSQIFSQPPDSPYFGEDIHFIMNGFVNNVEGYEQENIEKAPPQSGVPLIVWVYYTHYSGIEENPWITEYKTQTVVSSNGQYEVVFNLGDEVLSINDAGIETIDHSKWLIKYKSIDKLNDTQYSGDVYVIPMMNMDVDGNGIRDDFEWELVKKFCPNLRFNVDGTFCYPEPVQVMGGTNNSKINVTLTGAHHEKEIIAIEAYKVKYKKLGSTWKEIIPGFGKNEFGAPFNYSELIKENRIVLEQGDSISYPKIWKNYGEWGEEKFDAGGRKYLWIHLDWNGSNTNDWWNNYYPEQLQNKYPHTIYCTIWEYTTATYPCNSYKVGIQYWFFYPFDDWGNNHEGDWEHINVILNTQFIDNTVIEKVQFYFHEKWKEWTPDALEFINDTHVMVYVGGTFKEPWSSYQFNGYGGHFSGSSYPKPVRWIDVGGWWSDDMVYGRGPLLLWSEIINYDEKDINIQVWKNMTDINHYREENSRGIELLKDPEYLGYSFFENHKEMSWLKADINFGEPAQLPFTGALIVYRGPYHKPSWRTLGSNAEYSQY